MMSEIKRHRLYDCCMSPSREGAWVRYEDHVKWVEELEDSHEAEIKLMRLILEPTPKPKFKVGDRVRNDMFIGTVTSIETYEDQEDEFWVAWDKGGQSQCDYRTLTLYIPPTPAELIPTLKEHEWVQGTLLTEGSLYKNTFGPGTTYIWESGLWVSNVFLCDVRGFTSGAIETIERCNPPEVK